MDRKQQIARKREQHVLGTAVCIQHKAIHKQTAELLHSWISYRSRLEHFGLLDRASDDSLTPIPQTRPPIEKLTPSPRPTPPAGRGSRVGLIGAVLLVIATALWFLLR